MKPTPPTPDPPPARLALRHGLGPVLRARWRTALALPVLAVLGSALAAAWQPPEHAAQALLMLGLAPSTDLAMHLPALAPGPSQAPAGARVGTAAAAASDRLLATQIDVLRSPGVGRQVAAALAQHPDAELRAIGLAEQQAAGGAEAWAQQVWPKRLTLQRDPPSRVVGIQARGPDARYAAALANLAAQALLDALHQLQAEPARRLAASTRQQADAAATRLTQLHGAWGRHRADHGGLDVVELPALRPPARLHSPPGTPGTAGQWPGFPPVPATLPAGWTEVDRLAWRERSTLSSLEARWGEAHPLVQAAQARSAAVNAARQQLVHDHEHLQATELALHQAMQRHGDRVRAEQAARRAAAHSPISLAHPLQRQASHAAETYTTLQLQAQAAERAALAPLLAAQWLAVAEPPEHAASAGPGLALSLLLGCLAGISLVLLQESRGRRVRCRRDLSRTLGLPLLGVLDAPPASRLKRPLHASTPAGAAATPALARAA